MWQSGCWMWTWTNLSMRNTEVLPKLCGRFLAASRASRCRGRCMGRLDINNTQPDHWWKSFWREATQQAPTKRLSSDHQWHKKFSFTPLKYMVRFWRCHLANNASTRDVPKLYTLSIYRARTFYNLITIRFNRFNGLWIQKCQEVT